MRTALSRWAEPLLALLPDPRGVPLRRQATIAIVVSALLHVALLIFVAWYFAAPPPPKIQFARSKPKLKPLEIELVPLPKEEPKLFTLNEQNKPEYLDSTGLAKADKPAENPKFESDQDMIAASLNDPTGTAPLPSMDGRKDMSFTNFKSQNALLGPKPELFPDIALAAAPAPSPPIYKPQPVRQPAPEKTPPPPEPAEPEKAAPTAPDGVKEVEMPNENQFPLPPKKPPVPEPIMPPTKPQPSAELAKLVTPSPRKQDSPKTGYQSHQEQTKIEGSISNRGAAAVDAVKTPLGVYKKQISEAIGSRWHYYMKQHNDLVTLGLARVTFFVTKDGHIQDVRVIDNSSNDIFAFDCKRSVLEAELPPAPPEAFEAMKDGRMEITFTFNLYPN